MRGGGRVGGHEAAEVDDAAHARGARRVGEALRGLAVAVGEAPAPFSAVSIEWMRK